MRYLSVAFAAVLFAVPSFALEGQEGAARDSAVQRPEDTGAKEELAARILDAAQQRSGGRRWSEGARDNAKNFLLSRTLKELSDAIAVGGNRALDLLMGGGGVVGNTLGSAANDWVFTPLPSCRVLDTRAASGQQGAGTGPYGAGSVHSIFVTDNNPPSCGIPFPEAKAAVLNFVAVSASGNGNLRVWPWDSTSPAAPGTAVLNFTGGFNTSNYVVLPFCNTATATGGECDADVFIEPFVSSTHVVVDTVGYFAAPVATALDCTTQTNTVNVANNGETILETPACPAGYILTGGGHGYSGAHSGMWWWTSLPNGTTWLTSGRNETGGQVTVNVYGICCRLPGR